MAFLGRLIYLAVCAACLVFVSAPLAVAGAGAGVAAGPVLVAVVVGVALLGRPPWVAVRTPDQVRAGRLPGRVAARFVRRDRAWPQYFAVQVGLDLRGVVDRTAMLLGRLWTDPLRWWRAHRLTGWWPLFVPVAAVQLGVTVAATLTVLGVAGLVAGVCAVAWAIGACASYLLRGVDVGWQAVARSRASCQRCFELAAVPAYRCLGAHPSADRLAGDDLHRDLRPGRLGVWWRRCACGWRLPTTVLRAAASRRLQACCPSCGAPLFAGAGVVTDVRMPVFGAPSAGKTQLVMSALVGLSAAAGRAGMAVTLPDEHGRQLFEVYSSLVHRGAAAAKTDAAGPPVAVTVRLAKGRRVALLHVFDAAGEVLVDQEQNARLSYLDYARSLVFVLDPFSVPMVRDQAVAWAPQVLAEANPALHNPEDSYHGTVQRLRGYGVRTDRQRLAFVVSKADLLGRLRSGPPAGGRTAVRSWLCERGLTNLVLCAERDFKTVEFFLVCGRDSGPRGGFAPLSWVLAQEWSGVG